MPIRMTGMVSGLDTEALVSALVSGYSVKKKNLEKKKTTIEWQKDAWKDLNIKIRSLYNKADSLRFSSAYSIKTSSISDATKAKVTASSTAVTGAQSLEINKLASAGYLTGGKLTGATTGTTLRKLGMTSGAGTITLDVGGKKTDISVTDDTTINSFIGQLKDAGVNANFDDANGRIFVSSKSSGKDNDFSLTASDAGGLEALKKLGLYTESEADSAKYTELKGYYTDWDNKVKNEGYTGTLTEYMQGVIDSMDAKKADIAAQNDAIKAANSEIGKNNARINYANAYKAAEDKLAALDPEKAAKLEELLSQGDKSKYVVDGELDYFDIMEENENGTFSYYKRGEDGEKDEATMVTRSDKQKTIAETAEALGKEAGLITDDDRKAYDELSANISIVSSYKAQADNLTLTDEERAEVSATVADVDTAYSQGKVDEYTADQRAGIKAQNIAIENAETAISDLNKELAKHSAIDSGKTAAELAQEVKFVQDNVDGAYSAGAKKVNGSDATIVLNGVEYTGSSNNFNINGLSITAMAETTSAVTVSTENDVTGLYDKIKGFLKDYNELINEMSKLYNAESSKGYDPLTDEEKEAMSDDEVEKWEKKIKDALLRKDATLGGVMNAMTTSMYQSYKVGDKTYSLSSFGIKTMSYFEAAKNENYAYHIDGDKDDEATSGNADKLRAALESDPDSVVDFMKQLTSGLHKAIDDKMKSSSLSSAYTVYNDKDMEKQVKSYKEQVDKWQQKIEDYEDKYFKQFSAMEKALAKLQSQQSQLAGMLGGN